MRILALLLAIAALAQSQTPPATIAEKTKEMTAMPGYFPMFYDAKTGRILLEITCCPSSSFAPAITRSAEH